MAVANSVLVPTSRVFSSPRGDRLVRAQAVKAADKTSSVRYTTRIVVFSYRELGNGDSEYKRTASFLVSGLPSLILVNDEGTKIVTIDQLHGQSYGEVAAVYDNTGNKLAGWTLKDIFMIEGQSGLDRLMEFRREAYSTAWRGDVRLGDAQRQLWVSPPDYIKNMAVGDRTPSQVYLAGGFVIDLVDLKIERFKQPRGGKGGDGQNE